MQLFKKIPFFLFLLVVFFCLHGSVENYSYLNLKEVTVVALEISAGITLLFLIILVFSKNYIFSSLVTFFISLWYLFFGSIHDLIKSKHFLSFIQSYSVLIPLIIIGTVTGIVLLKRNKQLHPKLVLYLNLLLLLYCLFDGFLLLNKYRHDNKTLPVYTVAFDESKVFQKPDVYFLMFDEYAGYKSLQDSFGFKNDSLYNYLQQQYFKVMPTFSNYDYTLSSMSSILNMQYVPVNFNRRTLTQPLSQHRMDEIKSGQVFSIFKTMNYTIENYSIFDIQGFPALSSSNPFFPENKALLTDKIFHNRMLKDIGWWFVSGKFKIPFIKEHFLYRVDNYNKEMEEKVLKSAETRSTQPKFCYAHFFMPHGPYFRDSTGAFNSPEQIADELNKSLYLSYLKYTNSVIRSLVTKIVTHDPGAIIILMSDHGYYDYKAIGEYHPLNFDNICIFRSPRSGSNIYKEQLSSVNFFRYLFNTEFEQSLPYLKDSIVNETRFPLPR